MWLTKLDKKYPVTFSQIYAQPQPIAPSGSVQNLATSGQQSAGQVPQQQPGMLQGHFQPSMSIDENMQSYAKKLLPDLKHVIERYNLSIFNIFFHDIICFDFFFSGSNRSSQASTPQQEMVYDLNFQRNLQQRLSTIGPPTGQFVPNATVSINLNVREWYFNDIFFRHLLVLTL